MWYDLAMKSKNPATSRRRSARVLGRKTFVYFNDDERAVVDKAARLERRSVSSFVANAALDAAKNVLAKHNLKIPPVAS
jgi:uncharacterized protein (DUF1778 family)